MSNQSRDLTAQAAYFPGYSALTTDDPSLIEIEFDEAPASLEPSEISQHSAKRPGPKRPAQNVIPSATVPPPIPNRPAKPVPPLARGVKRTLAIHSQEEPKEDLTWREQVVKWFQGEGGAGLGVSLAVHTLLLLVLSFWILTAPKEDANLITTFDQTEVVETPSLLDVPIETLPDDFKPQVKDPAFDPGLNQGTDSDKLSLNSLDIGLNAGAGSLSGLKGGGVELRIPSQAITKGSFTAWTVPEDPQPGQQYVIMIRIKLKNGLKRYPRSDLKGHVVGTDQYRDYFGGPTESGYLPVNDDAVLYQACIVPGAQELVKDVITVESKILDEKQVIEIVF